MWDALRAFRRNGYDADMEREPTRNRSERHMKNAAGMFVIATVAVACAGLALTASPAEARSKSGSSVSKSSSGSSMTGRASTTRSGAKTPAKGASKTKGLSGTDLGSGR